MTPKGTHTLKSIYNFQGSLNHGENGRCFLHLGKITRWQHCSVSPNVQRVGQKCIRTKVYSHKNVTKNVFRRRCIWTKMYSDKSTFGQKYIRTKVHSDKRETATLLNGPFRTVQFVMKFNPLYRQTSL
jgi:hypothetical protein